MTLTTNFRTRSFANETHARALSVQIALFFAARSFEVVAYCVMPDHLHLLLEGASEEAFHDRVLREHDDTRSVVRYILQNPVRAGLVRAPREYPWLGSLRYSVADLEEHAGSLTPDWKRRV